MKRILFLIFPVIFLSMPFALTAAEKPVPGVPAIADANAEYGKKVADFYKAETEYYKEKWEKRAALMKKLSEIRLERNKAKDAKKVKETEAQTSDILKQLDVLSEEMAKHEISSAEFGLSIAQRRLELAKKKLESIQAKKAAA